MDFPVLNQIRYILKNLDYFHLYAGIHQYNCLEIQKQQQVYHLLLPACRRLYVTQIDADGGADVFFPEPAPELWRITEQSPWQEEQGLRYRYVTYERKEERDEV